ncbi:hypothetical protein K504DRAFT_450128 [Pleomassaria siparia CBS 279.74]|uniref:SRR1-like domain-containing protein n=1 Tax=Pleomassaria siparia CBS 279.74 TaxID=1314801 RepID=A0A6G1KKV4_9PLEO|nr:hypothetical protein K504DRAFT_450128 [Pleomassaria siparia CBS 279.74]
MGGLYELLLHGKPLFTRTMIEDAEKIWTDVNTGVLVQGAEYKVPVHFDHDHSEKVSLQVPECASDQQRVLDFDDYQTVCKHIAANSTVRPAFSLRTIPSRHLRDKTCFIQPSDEVTWETLREEWERNPASQRLKMLIDRHADRLQHVDQIVCFALGALDKTRKREYTQHLAACTIRDALEGPPGCSGGKKIAKILAQDPTYCDNCTSILLRSTGIETTTGFEGTLQVTENTLVVCISPSAPICQMLADLAFEAGRKMPIAMLCNDIDDDNYDEQNHHLSPHPARYPTADGPTQRLIEYKNACVEDIFTDFPDNITFDGHRYTSAEDWRADPPPVGPRMESVYAKETGERIEQLKAESRICVRGRNRSLFGDLRLYVRKGGGG